MKWVLLKWGIAAACIGFLLLIAGCSPISSGVITQKVYEPQSWIVCSVKPLILCPDDPDWRFDIEGNDETGWVYVTQEEFEQYEVGDRYPHPGLASSSLETDRGL